MPSRYIVRVNQRVIGPAPDSVTAVRRVQSHPEYMNDVSELRLSIRIELRVPGAGLFQPELPAEIRAPRDRFGPGAGLCRHACGNGAAVVLFLPANRAAGGGGAAPGVDRR